MLSENGNLVTCQECGHGNWVYKLTAFSYSCQRHGYMAKIEEKLLTPSANRTRKENTMKTLNQLLTDYSDAIKKPIVAQRNRTPLDPSGYIYRHEQAFNDPKPGMEAAIVNGIKMLANMAAGHEYQTGTKIGLDGYASDPFLDIAKGLISMLSTECGNRLCMGFCDGAIRNIAHLAGFTEEDDGI